MISPPKGAPCKHRQVVGLRFRRYPPFTAYAEKFWRPISGHSFGPFVDGDVRPKADIGSQ